MEELRKMREEAGVSQSELARQSGVDRATINRVEMGRRSPSIETLEKLAAAMGTEVADFFPKAQAPLWSGDGAGRRDIYVPWLEFVNSYADRWEEKIAQEALDLGAVYEFIAIVEDLAPVLSRLGLEEKKEQPDGYIYSYGPITGAAIARLMDLLGPLIEAGVKQFEESDIARLRRSREEMSNDQKQAASG